jgi:Bacteriocin-protection, YdeI or OmpD-Associated
MTPLFKKLNYKDHPGVVILHPPDNFAGEMSGMSGFCTVTTSFDSLSLAGFVLAFALTQKEVDAVATQFADKTAGDAVLWIAYPKGSSKKYTCDFNRDTGWEVLGKLGFEPVRQVAIDEDWSALRFRRIDFIKTMTRSFAMSEAGKSKSKPAPAPLTVPDDLAIAFEKAPDALAFFDQLAPSHRKEYLRWIEDAKRPETRATRVAKTVDLLLNKQKGVRM